ncbi:exodeoxyribonuclease III [Brevundimonas sp. Leaf363]|uniref:exodeoxyribonuclease III n=1 Tax=Brevundimonas sp. Leaf363 TaxID=1736353 RepID=UPI0006F274E0|nr:exodeoxyribonuclease III [Brevundimonas sp. Leaf363]KQS55518.1 exodeoxyribonuclease III [Brevundimonas sp. Leaf363]
MRIATFNINGVNTRLPNLLSWLKDAQPDVVCLQELKATDTQFPAAAIRDAGYEAVWKGEHRWNGVAILSRQGPPVVTRRALPGDPRDAQSRYIEAAVNGVLIGCLYLPNGNPQPGPKFAYKLAWMERLIAHAATLLDTDAPVVLAGDFNVVPTEADIYNSRSWKKNALLQPESRAAFARLLDAGWSDAVRERFPDDPPPWTFWQYFRQAWERDAGMRIDHLLLNPNAAARLTDAGVDKSVRGEEKASDHAPTWIELSL